MLDPAAPLTAYVPELAGSGYAGATVRHVLDIRSGIIFSEDYLGTLWVTHGAVEKPVKHIPASSTGDPDIHRRVLAVITFLDAL